MSGKKGYQVAPSLSTAFALYSMYRRNRNRNQYNRGARGTRRSARLSMRRGGSRTMTRTRSGTGTSGLGVTGQYDRKLVYLKKTMPRFKKRRWRSFVKKVNAAAEKELGNNTVLFNRQLTSVNTTSGNQIVLTLALYGSNGAADLTDDVAYIGNLGNIGNPTATDGVTVSPTTKYLFQSAVMDVTIQNVSSLTSLIGGVSTVTYPNECKLECDVYEVFVRRPSLIGTGPAYDTLEDLLNWSETYNYAIKDNTATPVTGEVKIQSRGATPFECASALSRFGIKVLKKTKFMLNQGETITYQVRDPKRHVAERQRLQTEEGFNFPKWTKVIFIISKLTPQASPIGSTNGTYQERIMVGSTRKYFYKVEGQNDDRSLYVPS